MATVEITVTNVRQGNTILKQRFELSAELAQEFLTQIEAMLAGLPAEQRLIRKKALDGRLLTEIEVTPKRPSSAKPTFEERFR
jgi:hypothetical protein